MLVKTFFCILTPKMPEPYVFGEDALNKIKSLESSYVDQIKNITLMVISGPDQGHNLNAFVMFNFLTSS